MYFPSCQTCYSVEITLAFLFVKKARIASILSGEVSPPAPAPCYPAMGGGSLTGFGCLQLFKGHVGEAALPLVINHLNFTSTPVY